MKVPQATGPVWLGAHGLEKDQSLPARRWARGGSQSHGLEAREARPVVAGCWGPATQGCAPVPAESGRGLNALPPRPLPRAAAQLRRLSLVSRPVLHGPRGDSPGSCLGLPSLSQGGERRCTLPPHTHTVFGIPCTHAASLPAASPAAHLP